MGLFPKNVCCGLFCFGRGVVDKRYKRAWFVAIIHSFALRRTLIYKGRNFVFVVVVVVNFLFAGEIKDNSIIFLLLYEKSIYKYTELCIL